MTDLSVRLADTFQCDRCGQWVDDSHVCKTVAQIHLPEWRKRLTARDETSRIQTND